MKKIILCAVLLVGCTYKLEDPNVTRQEVQKALNERDTAIGQLADAIRVLQVIAKDNQDKSKGTKK